MAITWLFTVACKQCAETINLGPAPSPAEAREPAPEAGEVYCPHCAAVHSYSVDEVQRALVDMPAAYGGSKKDSSDASVRDCGRR